MTIRQACIFYNVSKTALQRWLKTPTIKQTPILIASPKKNNSHTPLLYTI
ncbi:hypothetical protein E2545_11425 [Psychrobacter sp. 230]|nr:hypothetical protein E2545_11425 [Psychrobacter sp. 230]